MSINMHTIIERKLGIDATDIDGEKAMMNLEKGQYFMLNGVGSRIWDIIEKPCSVKEVISILKKEYDVHEETCKQSTFEFLGKLNHADLITIK